MVLCSFANPGGDLVGEGEGGEVGLRGSNDGFVKFKASSSTNTGLAREDNEEDALQEYRLSFLEVNTATFCLRFSLGMQRWQRMESGACNVGNGSSIEIWGQKKKKGTDGRRGLKSTAGTDSRDSSGRRRRGSCGLGLEAKTGVCKTVAMKGVSKQRCWIPKFFKNFAAFWQRLPPAQFGGSRVLARVPQGLVRVY